jgi:hypothetical protein
MPRKMRLASPKLNAEAVIDAERARLFIVVPEENITWTFQTAGVPFLRDEAKMKVSLIIKYGFKNYGKTPAIIQAMNHGTAIAESLPSVRNYEAVVDLPDRIVGPGDTSELVRVFSQMTNTQIQETINFGNDFWFYGDIAYDDTFGWRRKLEFVWHYDAAGRRFGWWSHRETQERQSAEPLRTSRPPT